MDFNRIIQLLKYDWMINRKNLRLFPIITLIIFAALSLSINALRAETSFSFLLNHKMVVGITAWISGFFEIAWLGCIVMITNILHMKFTDPRSSTGYLALPGNSTEKCTVMLLEYLIGYIAIIVLYLLCFYLVMGIGYLCDPSSEWAQNAFASYFSWTEAAEMADRAETNINNAFHSEGHITINGAHFNADEIMMIPSTCARMVRILIYMSPVMEFCNIMYFIILNMYFRYNGILKSIGIQVLTFVIMLIGAMLFIIPLASNLKNDSSVIAHLQTAINIITGLLYCVPLFAAAMVWFFHRQISRKQAK